MANQFSVTPLGGLDVGTKMTSIIEGGRQQNRIKQMREKAPEIFATGDPTQIANFMVEYPEMAQTMERATGVQDAGHKKEIVDMAKGLLTPGVDPKEVIAQYANTLQQSGRDPKMALSMLSKIMADPAQADDMGRKLLAIHSPAESIALQKATAPTGTRALDVAAIQEMEYLTAGLPPEQKQQAMLVKLGLSPRASETAQAKAQKVFAGEVAKLSAQLSLSPQVAGAVAAAKNQSKVEADVAVKDKSNELAWSVYDNAVSNLSKAMQGTITGPLLGFIPAVTANQQIADGAVAIMAPVLKDMFRSAGEGTFTKEDQAILMEMLPTRKDKPKARVAKLQAVDSMVKVKLGVSLVDDTEPVPTETLTPEQMRIKELEKIAFGAE